MVFQAIILLLTGGILLYAADYDLKNREIQLSTLILISILGFLYFINSDMSLINLIYAEIVLTMLFLIPTILGMGLGDMLLFWGLGFYFTNPNSLHTFLFGFFIAAAILTMYYIYNELQHGKRTNIKKIQFPLIPAILCGFTTYAINLLFLHI